MQSPLFLGCRTSVRRGPIPVSVTIILLWPFRPSKKNLLERLTRSLKICQGFPAALRASMDGATICLSPDPGAPLGPGYNGSLAMPSVAGGELTAWERYEAGLGWENKNLNRSYCSED